MMDSGQAKIRKRSSRYCNVHLGCFGHHIGTQFHFNASLEGTSNGNIKEDDWIFRTHDGSLS
jgi:hypothetical protein